MPVNTAPPTVLGADRDGSTLTESNGTWTNSPTSYSYQWRDCDSSGANCVDISGARSQTYVLTSSGVGRTIRVQEWATNSTGTGGPAASLATSVVIGLAPSDMGAPSISGAAQQGDTLTATSGAWTGTAPITYSYLWSDGTSGSIDTLSAADVWQSVSVTVTASNSAGSASATSATVGPVQPAPQWIPPSNTTAPTISGTTQQGSTLTVANGSWTNSPSSFAYQWQRCSPTCSNVAGATASSYRIAPADVGDTIDVVVTASNAGGSASQTSAPTRTVTVGSCSSTYSSGSLQTWVSSLTAGQTGCYVGTFTSGITLSTPNVTLDGTGGAVFNGSFQAITVSASNDTIHGGTFTNSTNGIETSGNGETGLTVDGVTMTGITNYGIQCTTCTDALIANSSITDDGVAAIEVESSTTGAQGFDKNVVTSTSITSQIVPGATGGPDGIEAYNGLTVSHDHFTAVTLASGLSKQHPDQIQLQGNWAKIYDNTFTNVGDSDVDMDNFANPNAHDIQIYNNVFQIQTVIDPYPDFVRLYHSSGPITSLNHVVIANNVFADSTGSGIPSVNLCYYEDCATATGSGNQLVNNEFVNLGPSNSEAVFARGPWTSSHNVFYGGGGRVHWLTDDKTTSLTFAQFIANVDPTSVTALPTFQSYTLPSTPGASGSATDDFHLATADTVSANTGLSLASLFNTDHDGVARPEGLAWDRGPFERVDG